MLTSGFGELLQVELVLPLQSLDLLVEGLNLLFQVKILPCKPGDLVLHDCLCLAGRVPFHVVLEQLLGRAAHNTDVISAICVPMIYIAPYVMLWMRPNQLRGKVGLVWTL